ncbi:hypothetical protein GO491_11090, partial [Flavobacteriaceae bacterium Ap0902]|nr:hypothetical protein [Flavobacteriaceae bacterium Ap0902]
MMRFILIIFCFIFHILVFAQSQDQNYIKTTEYLSETALADKKITIQYYDGLGRPMQSISVRQSPEERDIVLPIAYDGFGRQAKEYLPYEVSQSNGSFVENAAVGSESYYQTKYGSSISYAEKEFENSPLNRVLKQAAPGEEWKLGSGHEIEFEYKTNTNNEVIIFKAITQWNDSKKIYDISLEKEGNYNPGQLYKTITKDENHTSGKDHTIEEFKNKQGQVVLKRTYNAGVPHDTYYVYDIYGNLTYVLPPIVNHDSPINSTVLDNLCYQYKYDAKNRLVEKKLPGKDWEYMVYDNQDRLVATQDRLLRDKNQWLFTKYDKFGRVTYTGIAASSQERSALQNTINTSFPHNNSIKTEEVSFTKNGLDIQYAEDQGWPTNAIEIFTVQYYDNYKTPYPISIPASVENQKVINDIPDQSTHYVTTKGLPTVSFTRVLETEQWEKTYTFYDTKSRAIRILAYNHLDGGYTIVDNIYDFRGKVLKTITTHKKDSQSEDIKITDNFTYDHAERLLKHTQKIDNNQEELITLNHYDELGQLEHKKIGGQDISGQHPLQQIDYTYNIRGWLKGINDNGNEGLYPSDNTPNDLFRFKIEYNRDIYYSPEGVKPLYNGNIAQTEWMTITDNKSRTYTYAYDALNRLKKAYYGKSGIYKGNYDEHLQYDKNGNITELQRWGTADYKVKNYNPDMDELTYKYYDGTNRLKSVADATGSIRGFKDSVTQQIEYQYDANGNMTVDSNKGITQIQYNHLNLPTEIKFQNHNKITYLYNAQGIK